MAADEATRSSRRMDLNLYLGLPRAPRPRRPDLGSDLALSTPMPSSSSSSSAASAEELQPAPDPELHPPYSPSRAALASPPPPEAVAADPPPEYTPYFPGYGHEAAVVADDPPAAEPHAPYSPPYVSPAPSYPPPPPPPPPQPYVPSSAAIPELPDELGFSFHAPPPLVRPSELMGWEDRPSSSTASSSAARHEIFRPEAASIRRLLELTGRQWRLRARRFRSDLPRHSSEAPSSEQQPAHEAAAPPPSTPPQGLTDDVMDYKVIAEGAAVGASEEESEDRGKNAANFECNICFEMASEPVVTSCGHLFCWPCLYQWLNVHSDHKECPVCKGEVTEGNVTPIYGRGNSNLDAEKKPVEDGKPGPKIPPRPHGNRLESFRQQFHQLRPISRRFGDGHGILSSWRRLLDQQIMNSVSRFEGPPESAVREMIDNAQHASRVTTRMRARRLQREAENPPDGGSVAPDSGLSGNNTPNPPGSSTSSLFPEGIDFLQRVSLFGLTNTERLAAAISDLRRIAGPSNYGASTSSSNPPNPEPPVDGSHVAAALAADQVSASSTMAVIQGDAAISDSPGEPSNAGSSRSLRRRGRSNALGSLDVDGGGLHSRKRRRLN